MTKRQERLLAFVEGQEGINLDKKICGICLTIGEDKRLIAVSDESALVLCALCRADALALQYKRHLRKQIGMRVGAFYPDRNGMIHFLGYGEIVDIARAPDGVVHDEAMVGELRKVKGKQLFNLDEVIQLDRDRVVFGCECEWYSENKAKKLLLKVKEQQLLGTDPIDLLNMRLNAIKARESKEMKEIADVCDRAHTSDTSVAQRDCAGKEVRL